MGGQTLYDKIWAQHVVREEQDGTSILYVDRHLVQEVSSPQAFSGLQDAQLKVRRPDLTLAVADHNVPTTNRSGPIEDAESALQLERLEENVKKFSVPYIPFQDERQGIVHIIGPEQGFTLPGTVLVCGDSHTSTHGALGALAFGIGTSEVEHVLATQTLRQKKSKNMRIKCDGQLPYGVGAKDLILAIIAHIGTAGATGHVVEYQGSAVSRLSMEQRMTLCNMTIEAGARAGLVAPDAQTFAYIKGRPMAPDGDLWDQAMKAWVNLYSDDDAAFDGEVEMEVSQLAPMVTWGTSPEQALPISGKVPHPSQSPDEAGRAFIQRAIDYMDLEPGQRLVDIPIDTVFLGSCTNGRLEDLREAAAIMKGQRLAKGVQMLVVPGSGLVKKAAEAEGLHEIFLQAGCSWREPGCSMCVAMNADRLMPGSRAASTSNRNFEGRQGRGGRTHLMSPAMAAAAGVTGHLCDHREVKSS